MQSVRGTKDILPSDIHGWQKIESIIREYTSRFGYQEIRTPIFENTEVFKRTVGEDTDIVGKEMYSFPDRGGDSLTLRPEATAAVVRAAIQHNLTAQQQLARLYYIGPFFRYERPQKGRQRQFHQFGAELLGSATPEADIEIISLAYEFLTALGIHNHELQINTLGTPEIRAHYKTVLIDFFHSHFEQLSEDSKNRLNTNPLRILDSKNPQDKEICSKAPILRDFLDDESTHHIQTVLSSLDSLGIRYTQKPSLVRGLDYYSHTVFEFTSNALGSQDALGGGGRYNHLFEHFEGKHTPSIGFGFGMERLLLAMEAQGSITKQDKADIYIIGFEVGEARKAAQALAAQLRKTLSKTILTDVQNRSLKAQMKESDKLGAKQVIIIGPDEAKAGTCILKNLETGLQETHLQSEVLPQLL